MASETTIKLRGRRRQERDTATSLGEEGDDDRLADDGLQRSRTEVDGGGSPAPVIVPTARILNDEIVAAAVKMFVPLSLPAVRRLMRRWVKPILKAHIPGIGARLPTEKMLQNAKDSVVRFFDHEQDLGPESDVLRAFLLVSGEPRLRLDWESACARVRRAKLDKDQSMDSWCQRLAMTTGQSHLLSEIYICGSRRLSQGALNSLVCHEALHNMARRLRPGNPFLSEDAEHVAMALLGDPQFVHYIRE